ncbi:contactin-like [Amphibalanus amphitrite]|uniref:contactin-like n=1 Tax=Amphibalanus amphitrite TaxID=1232801 RepID=UPI001C9291AF|nr:contactin-like [Amphibalanus amphitrite]XP_043215271.1 contactin-like [Amphibalanus amphitrite]XP_043215272.1 contactin-like [Amphibalanus amphitrite]
MLLLLGLVVQLGFTAAQLARYDPTCPKNWVQYEDACYRFVRSPIKRRDAAREACQGFAADLMSLNTMEEHAFVVNWLRNNDPQHRDWYMGARQQTSNVWTNDGDSTPLQGLESAFLPEQENVVDKSYAAYSFSEGSSQWGLRKVPGVERLLYICEIKLSEQNFVDVGERDHTYGRDVTEARLVPRGPKMVLQPKPAVFDISQRSTKNDVTIKCLADAYPYPTYEWYEEVYEDDKLIYNKVDPLKDSRFTISGGVLMIYAPDQVGERGKYHCRATNKFGTIVSESVQLAFGLIGEFNQKRSNEIGQMNFGKGIYCDPPQHFPEVHYLWVRDYFPNFVEEDQRVFVSHDGHLYFSSLETIDQAEYMCNVKSTISENGKIGPKFRLDVEAHSNYQQLRFAHNFPKSFPEAPREGEEVRLECVAFGYPVPHYNWTRRGGDLPRAAHLTNYDRVLTLPEVRVEDEGEYVCRASNSKVSSEASVTLSIQAKPRFTIPLEDQHINEGSDLAWTCEAFGIPEVTYAWLRNGVVLDPKDFEKDPRIEIQDSLLTFKNVTDTDQAMYQCRATNQLGSTYSSAQLRVLAFAPSFAKQPLEALMYAGLGMNQTIACEPEAAPRPDITWTLDGRPIGTGGRRRVLANGYLQLDPVSQEDAGEYTCTATNQYGSDSSSGRLRVLEAPVMVEQPQRLMVKVVNDMVILRCEAEADPGLDLAYVWTHNGIPIDYHEIDTRYHRLRQPGYLQIRNVSLEEDGTYRCTARTAVGEISAESRLTIAGPPEAPGGVQAFELNATSGRLEWQDFDDNGRHISMYRIEARTNWNSSWFIIKENITVERDALGITTLRRYVFPDLLVPFSWYEFRVSAANPLGYGPPSPPSPRYNTAPARPFTPPTQIHGGGGKIGDLTIKWKPLTDRYRNAPGVYYKVFWMRHEIEPEIDYNEKTLEEYGNIGQYVVTIQRKYFYSQYKVKVQAFNSMGAGPISEEYIIYSAEGMPQAVPTEVAAKAYNSTALNVTWRPIEHTREGLRGRLLGHRVKYWIRDADEATESLILLKSSLEPWALVVGLQPFTEYYVRVMAYNSAGSGQESERFLERTYKNAPLNPPTAVNVEPINPRTVRVTWRIASPSVDEEPLRGFKVRVWERDQDISDANDTYVPLGQRLEAYINDLEPGAWYKLRVLAYSAGGDGKMSSPEWQFQMGNPDDLRGGSSRLEQAILHVLAPLAACLVWLRVTGAV